MKTIHKRPLAALIAALLVGGNAGIAFAQATSAPAASRPLDAAVERRIDLPAAALERSLAALAREFGISLAVDPALAAGRTGAALSGSFSAREAFARLLAGTGLAVVARADGGYALVRAAGTASTAQDGERDAHMLQVIEVVGRRATAPFAEHTFSVTKTETHVLDIPQSVSAVTKEVIHEQGLLRLNDIAPFVAGLNEFSVYDDLTIRGFRNSDDRRINGMRSYNNFWTQPSIAHLERVEVIKGPAAATFGAASPGGVINMVTKKPLPEPRREVQATGASFDSKYAAADLTGPLDKARTLLYRVNLAAEDSDSFRKQVFNRQYTLAPSLSFLPRAGTRVNVDLVYTDLGTVLDRGQPNIRNARRLGIVPIEVSVTQPGDLLDQRNLTSTVAFDQRLGDNWSLALAHMNDRFDERLVEHRIQNFVTDSSISLLYIDRARDARVSSSTAYVTGRLRTAAVAHRLVAGVDYVSRENLAGERQARNVAVFDLLNPQYLRRDPTTYTFRAPQSWGGKSRMTAAYLSNQMSVGAWEVLAGLRYDEFRSEGHSNGVTTPAPGGHQVSPRLGVVYKLDESRSLYGTWLTGFEPPDEFLAAPRHGGPFEPEDSKLYEIGYKQLAFGGALLFTVAVYQLDKNNAIVWANHPANPDLYVQRGQERARGVELEASGRIGRRIGLIANYAYNDARITKDANPANVGKVKENAPRHAASLWGRYDFGNGWGAGAGLTHVAQRQTFEAALQLPAYTIGNVGVFYGARSVDLALMVKNVTDEVHWTGGYNFGRVFPGDPRSVSLNVKYRF
jgi:iron complex outermembrane receptor protein